jgi:DNA-binding transcriptional LysR family regulator
VDRFESMSVFVTVAAAGSLSAAGRRLRMPLPTVSRKVAELEAHLGAKLFVRSTRKLALTDTGRSFLADCERVLAAVAEAERGAADEYRAPRGELVLTAPVAFGRLHLLPVLADFLKTNATVSARLVLADRLLNLIEEHVDVAVRIGPLPDSSLVAVRIGRVRQVVAASPAYLKARGAPRSAAEIAAHDCVTFAAVAGAQSWTFRDRQRAAVHSRLVVDTAEAAVDGAVAGLGLVRVLSYQAAEAVKSGRLEVVLESLEPAPLPVNLLYTREARLTAKVKAFLDFSVPRLRASLADAGL